MNSTPDNASTAHVLAVDDERPVLEMERRVLTRLGYRVTAVGSAEEALEALADADPVDLLLTDVVMPGQNGIDLARTVRRDYPAMPIIFVSGFMNDERIAAARSIEGARILNKPFQINDLKTTLAEALEEA